MVTFVCQYCDVTLKKKQAQGHIRGRCSPGAMICIDCSGTFYGNDHKSHISCISEQDKHWGDFAKSKKTKPIAKEQKNAQSVQKNSKVEQNKEAYIQQQIKTDKKKQSEPEKQQTQTQNNIWKGWKIQIKSILRENQKLQKSELLKKLRKTYQKKNSEQPLTGEQIEKIFQERINKISSITTQTFYTLNE